MTNNIAKIRAALEQARELIPEYCGVRTQYDDAFAALAELEKAAAEPVATLVGFDVETGLPADIAWHADCATFNSGDNLYAAPPAPGMFTAEEMEAAKLAAYRAGADKAIAEMIRTS